MKWYFDSHYGESHDIECFSIWNHWSSYLPIADINVILFNETMKRTVISLIANMNEWSVIELYNRGINQEFENINPKNDSVIATF
jgi:hypothetical protein